MGKKDTGDKMRSNEASAKAMNPSHPSLRAHPEGTSGIPISPVYLFTGAVGVCCIVFLVIIIARSVSNINSSTTPPTNRGGIETEEDPENEYGSFVEFPDDYVPIYGKCDSTNDPNTCNHTFNNEKKTYNYKDINIKFKCDRTYCQPCDKEDNIINGECIESEKHNVCYECDSDYYIQCSPEYYLHESDGIPICSPIMNRMDTDLFKTSKTCNKPELNQFITENNKMYRTTNNYLVFEDNQEIPLDEYIIPQNNYPTEYNFSNIKDKIKGNEYSGFNIGYTLDSYENKKRDFFKAKCENGILTENLTGSSPSEYCKPGYLKDFEHNSGDDIRMDLMIKNKNTKNILRKPIDMGWSVLPDLSMPYKSNFINEYKCKENKIMIDTGIDEPKCGVIPQEGNGIDDIGLILPFHCIDPEKLRFTDIIPEGYKLNDNIGSPSKMEITEKSVNNSDKKYYEYKYTDSVFNYECSSPYYEDSNIFIEVKQAYDPDTTHLSSPEWSGCSKIENCKEYSEHINANTFSSQGLEKIKCNGVDDCEKKCNLEQDKTCNIFNCDNDLVYSGNLEGSNIIDVTDSIIKKNNCCNQKSYNDIINDPAFKCDKGYVKITDILDEDDESESYKNYIQNNEPFTSQPSVSSKNTENLLKRGNLFQLDDDNFITLPMCISTCDSFRQTIIESNRDIVGLLPDKKSFYKNMPYLYQFNYTYPILPGENLARYCYSDDDKLLTEYLKAFDISPSDVNSENIHKNYYTNLFQSSIKNYKQGEFTEKMENDKDDVLNYGYFACDLTYTKVSDCINIPNFGENSVETLEELEGTLGDVLSNNEFRFKEQSTTMNLKGENFLDWDKLSNNFESKYSWSDKYIPKNKKRISRWFIKNNLSNPLDVCYDSSQICGNLQDKESCDSSPECAYDNINNACNPSSPLTDETLREKYKLEIDGEIYYPYQVKSYDNISSNEDGNSYLENYSKYNYINNNISDFNKCNNKLIKYKIGDRFYETSSNKYYDIMSTEVKKRDSVNNNYCINPIYYDTNNNNFNDENDKARRDVYTSDKSNKEINEVWSNNLLNCREKNTASWNDNLQTSNFVKVDRELLKDGYQYCYNEDEDEMSTYFPINPPYDDSSFEDKCSSHNNDFHKCIETPYCKYNKITNKCSLLNSATCKKIHQDHDTEGYSKIDINSNKILRDYTNLDIDKDNFFKKCNFKSGMGYFNKQHYDDITTNEDNKKVSQYMSCGFNNPLRGGNEDMDNMIFTDLPGDLVIFDEDGKSKLCEEGYELTKIHYKNLDKFNGKGDNYEDYKKNEYTKMLERDYKTNNYQYANYLKDKRAESEKYVEIIDGLKNIYYCDKCPETKISNNFNRNYPQKCNVKIDNSNIRIQDYQIESPAKVKNIGDEGGYIYENEKKIDYTDYYAFKNTSDTSKWWLDDRDTGQLVLGKKHRKDIIDTLNDIKGNGNQYTLEKWSEESDGYNSKWENKEFLIPKDEDSYVPHPGFDWKGFILKSDDKYEYEPEKIADQDKRFLNSRFGNYDWFVALNNINLPDKFTEKYYDNYDSEREVTEKMNLENDYPYFAGNLSPIQTKMTGFFVDDQQDKEGKEINSGIEIINPLIKAKIGSVKDLIVDYQIDESKLSVPTKVCKYGLVYNKETSSCEEPNCKINLTEEEGDNIKFRLGSYEYNDVENKGKLRNLDLNYLNEENSNGRKTDDVRKSSDLWEDYNKSKMMMGAENKAYEVNPGRFNFEGEVNTYSPFTQTIMENPGKGYYRGQPFTPPENQLFYCSGNKTLLRDNCYKEIINKNMSDNEKIIDKQTEIPPLISSPCSNSVDIGSYTEEQCIENNHIWMKQPPMLKNGFNYQTFYQKGYSDLSESENLPNNLDNTLMEVDHTGNYQENILGKGYCIDTGDIMSSNLFRELMENNFNPNITVNNTYEIPEKFNNYITNNKEILNKFISENNLENKNQKDTLEGFNNFNELEDNNMSIYNSLSGYFSSKKANHNENNNANKYSLGEGIWGESSPYIQYLDSDNYIKLKGNIRNYDNWIDEFKECGWEADLSNVSNETVKEDIKNMLARKCNRLFYTGLEYDQNLPGNLNAENPSGDPIASPLNMTENRMKERHPYYSRTQSILGNDNDFNKNVKGEDLPSFCNSKYYVKGEGKDKLQCSYNLLSNDKYMKLEDYYLNAFDQDRIPTDKQDDLIRALRNEMVGIGNDPIESMEFEEQGPLTYGNYYFEASPGRFNLGNWELDYRSMIDNGNILTDNTRPQWSNQDHGILTTRNTIKPLGTCPGYDNEDSYSHDNQEVLRDSILMRKNKGYNTIDSDEFKINNLKVNSNYKCVSTKCFLNKTNKLDSNTRDNIRPDTLSHYFASDGEDSCQYVRKEYYGSSLPSPPDDMDTGTYENLLNEVLPWPITRAQTYLSCGGGIDLTTYDKWDKNLDLDRNKVNLNQDLPDSYNRNETIETTDYYLIEDKIDPMNNKNENLCYDLNVDILNAWYYSINNVSLESPIEPYRYPDFSLPTNLTPGVSEDPGSTSISYPDPDLNKQNELDYKINYFESVICSKAWGGYSKNEDEGKIRYNFIADNTSDYSSDNLPPDDKIDFILPTGWVFTFGDDMDKITEKYWIINRDKLKREFEKNLKFISPTGFCKPQKNNQGYTFDNDNTGNFKFSDNFNEMWWPLNGPNKYYLPGNYTGQSDILKFTSEERKREDFSLLQKRKQREHLKNVWKKGNNILTPSSLYDPFNQIIDLYPEQRGFGGGFGELGPKDVDMVIGEKVEDEETYTFLGLDARDYATQSKWSTWLQGKNDADTKNTVLLSTYENTDKLDAESYMNMEHILNRIGEYYQNTYINPLPIKKDDKTLLGNYNIYSSVEGRGGNNGSPSPPKYWTDKRTSFENPISIDYWFESENQPIGVEDRNLNYTPDFKNIDVSHHKGVKTGCNLSHSKRVKDSNPTDAPEKDSVYNNIFKSTEIPQEWSGIDSDNWFYNMKPWLAASEKRVSKPDIDILNPKDMDINELYESEINGNTIIDHNYSYDKSVNQLGKGNVSTIIRAKNSKFNTSLIDTSKLSNNFNKNVIDSYKRKTEDNIFSKYSGGEQPGFSEIPWVNSDFSIKGDENTVGMTTQSFSNFAPINFAYWMSDLARGDENKQKYFTSKDDSDVFDSDKLGDWGMTPSGWFFNNNINWTNTTGSAEEWRDYTVRNLSPTDLSWKNQVSSPINGEQTEYLDRKETRNNWLDINDKSKSIGVFQGCKYDEECQGLCITNEFGTIPQIKKWTNPNTGYFDSDWTLINYTNPIELKDGATGICQFEGNSTIRKIPELNVNGDENYSIARKRIPPTNTFTWDRGDDGGKNIGWSGEMDSFCTFKHIQAQKSNSRYPEAGNFPRGIGFYDKENIGTLSMYETTDGPGNGNPCISNVGGKYRELQKKCLV